MIGQKYNKLTIIKMAGVIIKPRNDKDRQKQYREYKTVICECECGNITEPKRLDRVKVGKPKSCGCLIGGYPRPTNENKGQRQDSSRVGKTRKKYSYTYNSFKCMRDRCINPNNNRYYDYGGRGIKVCERWKWFSNFLEDMGERPEGRTLDRVDVNGNYEPSNCRWSTPKEQRNNQRPNDKLGSKTGPNTEVIIEN